MRGGRPTVISIRWVVTGVAVVLVAASVLSVGAMAERNLRRALSREIETRLVLEARNLALTSSGALLSEFPELTLVPLVKTMQAERPELAFVVVVDHLGRIQGHADPRHLGERYAPPADLTATAGATRLEDGERLLASRSLLVVEAPVSYANGPQIGRAVVAMQRAYVERAVSAGRRSQFLFLAALLAVAVTLGLVLLGGLLKPVAALRTGLDRIGRGDLDTPLAVHDRTELGLLAVAVNDMAARLKVARVESRERERLSHELELAREIQQRLLPRGRRTVSGYTLVGAHRAAAEVGGDYYDFIDLEDGRIAVAIADVSGKGLGGCLVTSMLSALVRALHAVHVSPAALLVDLERHLSATLEPGEFVTMFYGLLDPARGRLVYASAGHTPLLLWRAATGRVEWHPTRGIPLGAVRGGALAQTLEDRTLDLQPGDLIAQFTDGISEAFDRSGREAFGFDRVDQVVRDHARRGPDELVAALSAAVAGWTEGEPQDDETLLVVARPARVAGEPQQAARGRVDALARLAEAESTGPPLSLSASLESLSALGPWLERAPHLSAIPRGERRQLELALYEACANIAEHGLKLDAEQTFDVWWVPGGAETDGLDARVRAGYFLLRDHGFPFSPGRWQPRDLDDVGRRLAGRGFGLDLIHLSMDEVVYRPATPAGNLTVLTFDPAKVRQASKEDRHG
ncbi:MAG TPA: SpoIIE family protein phosphatase [Candidatus Eisenbacteria bacterium]|nr:SpoIIE family protein phosphatase [Candidatus Eisenbacteria bacterium]